MHTRKRYAAALATIVYRTARLYMFVVFMYDDEDEDDDDKEGGDDDYRFKCVRYHHELDDYTCHMLRPIDGVTPQSYCKSRLAWAADGEKAY